MTIRSVRYIWVGALATLALLAVVGLVVALVGGTQAGLLAVVAGLLLAGWHHLRSMQQLALWTREPIGTPVPRAHGVWGFLFADLGRRAKLAYDMRERLSAALERFRSLPRLAKALWHLQQVGLGYLRLGQPATTLSGGEAQRLKIARELAEAAGRAGRRRGRKLYVLDEPTTGLHLDDVRTLCRVLDRLVDAGHTVLVIEHHLDVIKRADWVIDLGPGAGADGGAPPVPEARVQLTTQVLPSPVAVASPKAAPTKQPAPRRTAQKKAPARKAAAKPVQRWLPTGTGMWLHDWERSQQGNPRAVVARARAVGLSTLYVQTGSSKKGFIGTATLHELRSAFAAADAAPHVGRFVDMHDIGDALLTTGFRDPVLERESRSSAARPPQARPGRPRWLRWSAWAPWGVAAWPGFLTCRTSRGWRSRAARRCAGKPLPAPHRCRSASRCARPPRGPRPPCARA